MNRVLAVGLFTAALAVRLLFGLAADRDLVSDERDYDALGWTLAATGRYQDEGRSTAYRPIGYPAFVAAIYAVAGRSPAAVRAVQAVLDAGTALVLFVALRRRAPRAALGAAALWAFYPPAVVSAALLYPESLFGFLLVLAAAGLSREPRGSPAFRFVLGVLLGVAVLVKTAALILVFLLPWFALRGGNRWRHAAALAAGVLLVIVPWMWRNARAVGSPALATSSGINLLIGNHPDATGGYATDVPDSMRPRSAGEAAASREAGEAARTYIARRPGRFVVGIARRWAHLFMGEGELAVTAFHPRPGDRATSYRRKVGEVGPGRLLLLWGPFVLLLLAGAAGFLARRWDSLSGFFLALLVAWLVAHGVTFGGSRFHAPWMPFLAAFAAERFAGGPAAWRWRGPRTALWVVFAALCLALWLVEGAAYLRS